jgi:uncharacterized protein YcbK (DUF882 family)
MNNFEHNEFDSPDLPGSGWSMSILFLNKLDDARALAGIPFIINSGFRTEAHNKKVGGKSDSSHLKGCAADIRVNDSRSRFIILKALQAVGFTRIGIGNGFIHVDDDQDKSQEVIWVYS